MNSKLRYLLLETPKITGNYGIETISYMQESLTMDEYKKVGEFFIWLIANGLTYGHGNLDERWKQCFLRA